MSDDRPVASEGGPSGATRAPPILAPLARHGVAAPALARAADRAVVCGVAEADVLLADGLVGEDALYRALAAETGLPFLESGFEVDARCRYRIALRSGVAPLARGAGEAGPAPHVVAPRGAAFADLLHRPRSGPGRIAVTTPTALREAVFRAKTERIGREAAEDLPRRQPDNSFHGGMTIGQLVLGAILLMVIGGALVAAGRPALELLLLLMSVPFLGLAAIKIAACLEPVPIRPPRRRSRIPEADLPVYTVLVPLYRETEVLPQLIGALTALDYPAAKLDIKILLEEDDGATLAALRQLDPPPFVEVIVVPRGLPRTKPRALNVGLALARGTFLTIYDAEDVPDPQQLRDAVAAFRAHPPEVACLQARLVIDNTRDGWLPAFFTVEYGALFDVVNPALARFDLPIPLGGTSNHIRTEVLQTLGGWDAWNVTEDADLALRLASAGYTIADLPSATLEEAPARLGGWLGQRARWMKGYLQVTVTHSRRPVRLLGRLGLARLLGAAAIVAGTVASALLYPILTLLALLEILSGRLFEAQSLGGHLAASVGLIVFGAGILAMMVPGLVAIARRGWWSLWPYALLMPAYYLLVSIGAWRGLFEFLLSPDSWNKTTHGLARTSRAAGTEP